MPLTDTDIERLRTDTPGAANVIHFNNAGSSLPAWPVLNAVTNYLQEEALKGGYETEDRYSADINNTYQSLAELIGAQPQEIALVENASMAWCIAFHGIGLQPGDEVIVSEFEYITNMLSYRYAEKHHGIKLRTIANDENGEFSLPDLEQAINSKTKLIAVTHVASATGGILPVEEIGRIAKKHGVLYLLDACQSVGQIPVDVNKIQCDLLSVTGRKYLRAPRGTGFLFVRESIQDMLDPLLIDGHSITSISDDGYTLLPGAKRFELYEKNRALTLGLSAAAAYALDIGIDNIWQRVNHLASHLRQLLGGCEGIAIHDTGHSRSGIVTFTVSGYTSKDVKAYLAKHGINVSVALARSTPIFMAKHQLADVVRASVHYYNTEAEVSQLCVIIQQLQAGR